mmetsp:Transcript_12198/g.20716  ORF Transcript_12198/g.20716 Transcript_12198/m.20716 type:complete len:103 (+) Transcript_12198:2021-2329(+)
MLCQCSSQVYVYAPPELLQLSRVAEQQDVIEPRPHRCTAGSTALSCLAAFRSRVKCACNPKQRSERIARDFHARAHVAGVCFQGTRKGLYRRAQPSRLHLYQ